MNKNTLWMISVASLSLLHIFGGLSINAMAQANEDNNHNFGLGLMIGEPSGVTIKSWFNRQSAFDIGAA